jgi:hypothetical protein
MNRTRRNIDRSINSLQATLLRARVSHESSQQLLLDTRMHIRTLQQQLRDLQQHARFKNRGIEFSIPSARV